MSIQLAIVISLIFVLYLWSRYRRSPPENQKKMRRNFFYFIVIAIFSILAFKGYIGGLVALIASLFAALYKFSFSIGRFVSITNIFARAFSLDRFFFIKLTNLFGKNKDAKNTQEEISIQEAADILGIPTDASEDIIIKAHRQLINKIHPDRGGSQYLCVKANLAKEKMLSQCEESDKKT